MPELINRATYPANDDFALVEGPHDHKQRGLDLYVRVINLHTGEHCHKKLYRNSKGLHFKHTGYPPMYLDDMVRDVIVIPYQYRFLDA